MEAVAKLCEECTHYVSATCEGKSQADLATGKLPCKKYEFHAGELEEQAEPTTEPVIAEQAEQPAETKPMTAAARNKEINKLISLDQACLQNLITNKGDIWRVSIKDFAGEMQQIGDFKTLKKARDAILSAYEKQLADLRESRHPAPPAEKVEKPKAAVVPVGTKINLADNPIAAAIFGQPAKARKNVKGGAKSEQERRADFQRLGVARVNKAVAAIKLLGNLNNKYAYSYEPADVQALRTLLETTIAETFDQFKE